MVKLTRPNPTLDAIDEAIESKQSSGWRPHLGASMIGDECSRKLWYIFRWAKVIRHKAQTLRIFRRGHHEEHWFVRDLRNAGVTVWEVDPNTAEQFRVSALGGHFASAVDGVGLGLLEAPKTAHVLEFKTSNEKGYKELQKSGVQEAKPMHYDQMQTYMLLLGLERAFYMAVNKNTDEIYSERIKLDKPYAESIIHKAERIITAKEPLDGISRDPSWYKCKHFCDFADICHGSDLPARNCRTCLHSTPTGEGTWHCDKHMEVIPIEEQKKHHECHRYIPALVKGEPVRVDGDDVVYNINGKEWADDGTSS